MERRSASYLMAGCVLSLLTGCVSQAPVKYDFQVSQTLPKEMAIDYLLELEHGYNGTALPLEYPVCRYSERSIAGSMITRTLVGSYHNRASESPFSQWRVSDIHTFSPLVGGGNAVMVVVRSDSGAICAPLREWGDHGQKATFKEIEKSLAALVSLGVRYDPEQLGRKGR